MIKKKALCIAASLTLAMAVSSAGFAKEVDQNYITGNTSAEVKGTYIGSETEKVYRVDLRWDGMTFTYQAADKGIWNPKSHTYSGGTAASWTGTGTITVENHSNAAIEVTPTYTPATAYQSATITFSTDELKVESADNHEADDGSGQSKTGTISVTPGGSLPEGTTQATIGRITLSIAEASSQSETQQ